MVYKRITATQLAKKHHPDRNSRCCIIIEHAQEVLSNIYCSWLVSIVPCIDKGRSRKCNVAECTHNHVAQKDHCVSNENIPDVLLRLCSVLDDGQTALMNKVPCA